MTEAQFQTRFTRWAKYNLNNVSGACELKITHGKSLPFSAVAPHQIAALQFVKNGCLQYKIPDVGMSQKPFDFFFLAKQNAYVVIMFYRPRQDTFYLIDIDTFVEYAKSSTRKSLTEDECVSIASITGRLQS